MTDSAHLRTIDHRSPYLKIHLKNGGAYVLYDWRISDSLKTAITGTGRLLDINRNEISRGVFTVAADSVALFETNVIEPSGATQALTVITGVSLAITAACIADPKACFGSCPTFYVTDGNSLLLQSEGFSNSVAPILEATDIDALYRAHPSGYDVQVTMKNEALETHVIRFVKLLAAPRSKHSRVVVTSKNEFFEVGEFTAPFRASAAEGNCSQALSSFDGVERFSPADSLNLAEREVLELEFDKIPNGELGLVIASRQTLLTTFLFYQTLAYMGTRAGDWLAALQRTKNFSIENAKSVGRVLGGIEVFIPDSSGGWALVAATNETGPIATDLRMLKLPLQFRQWKKVRLRMTKGLWRLDYVALAQLHREVRPLRLDPYTVFRSDKADPVAQDQLTDSAKVLTTFPGDRYELHYRLPDAADNYEFFIESRGYYLEWMREEWFKEEDPNRAAMMFYDPERALVELAPAFKKVEPQMEKLFWNSKYVRP